MLGAKRSLRIHVSGEIVEFFFLIFLFYLFFIYLFIIFKKKFFFLIIIIIIIIIRFLHIAFYHLSSALLSNEYVTVNLYNSLPVPAFLVLFFPWVMWIIRTNPTLYFLSLVNLNY